MISQYIITLLSAFVSFYLPFEDVATKVACSMALSQVIVIIGEKLFSGTFSNINLWKYFFTNNYVIIKQDNPFYEKFIELLYKKYLKQLSGCQLYTDFGTYKMMIDELNSKHLYDNYTFNGLDYKIKINLEGSNNNNSNDNKKVNKGIIFKNIIVTTNGSMDVLESYVQNMIKKCNENTVNNLMIYKPNVGSGKKRFITWKSNSFKTNKNIKNTIVSEEVNEYFFADVKNFITKEDYYTAKGLSYKRGYLLHGEPGCGKTSIIKAIANEYNLPIFIIDLSIFESNNELTKLVNDINGLVADKQRHLLVFEDVDRSKTFKSDYYDKKITQDCILNIIDGLDESYGRIVVMTTNNINVLKKMPSLVRPGRIDVVINVTVCTVTQIKKIMELYYDREFDEEVNLNIKITPAKLIQLISLIKDENKIIASLNKILDFSEFDVEKFVMQDKASVDNVVNVNNNSDDNKENIKVDKPPRHISILKKKENLLENKKNKLNLEEFNDTQLTEKNKLLMDRKKIALRLCELDYDKYKKYCDQVDEIKKKKETQTEIIVSSRSRRRRFSDSD